MQQLLFESTLPKTASSALASDWATHEHLTQAQLIHRLPNSLSHGLTQHALQGDSGHQLNQSNVVSQGFEIEGAKIIILIVIIKQILSCVVFIFKLHSKNGTQIITIPNSKKRQ